MMTTGQKTGASLQICFNLILVISKDCEIAIFIILIQRQTEPICKKIATGLSIVINTSNLC